MREAEIGGLHERYGHLVARRCRGILRAPVEAEDAL